MIRLTKNIILFLVIMPIILSSAMPSLAAAKSDEEKQSIQVAVPNEEVLTVERVVYHALQGLGYDVVPNHMGMKTATISTDDGEMHVLATQTEGTEETYLNLTMVPVPISYVDMLVFAKDGFSKPISGWQDLAGLKVAYHAKNLYVEKHIPENTKATMRMNDYDTMYDAVLTGHADVAIVPQVEFRVRKAPAGVTRYTNLERKNTYSYVNNQYKFLVPELTKAYQDMTNSGMLNMIKANKYPEPEYEKTVLHISSYSTDMIWERNLVNGVHKGLADIPRLLYYNFPLNLKRISNQEAQFDLMSEQIRSSFITKNPDVVIVSDNDAMNFAIKYYDMLFAGTPVVFCGVNDFKPEMIAGLEDHFTGITEDISVTDTVDELLRQYPRTRNIYVVNDYSTAGLFWKSSMQSALEPYLDRVNVMYNNNVAFPEVLKDIKAQGAETVVLYGTFYRDVDGIYYSEAEMADALGTVNSRPAYALMAVNMGLGVLGGKVVDSEKHGFEAGKMVSRILDGATPDEIDILIDPDGMNTWTFDYKVAERFGLNTSQFPKHKPVNKTPTFLESNPVLAIFVITSSVMSIIIIMLLSFFMKRLYDAKQKIEYTSLHDPLTGLVNRAGLEKVMNEAFLSGEEIGILLFDLDNFKGINDVYGHTIGDRCLVEVASRLTNSGLELLAISRIGGDEFFIVAKADRHELEQLAIGVLKLFGKLFDIDDIALHVTASIGLSMFPTDGDNSLTLMQNADLALYEAKARGKNQLCFYDTNLSEQAKREAELLQILRDSLYTGEMFLVYQPVVDMVNRKMRSFEALLRIDSKQHGKISPDEFIPVAETSGLIMDVGEWVLETSCRFAKQLYDDGIDFECVSVNVSSVQLSRDDFISVVDGIIEKTGINPSMLQLEITESVFLRNSDDNIKKLTELQRKGIIIALDDFGTGYSSMKYLTQLPIDVLKIDKSFIDEIESDRTKNEIAHLIIDMAHALGLKVVAEGIEREAQWSLIKDMSCDLVQGYITTSPLKDDDFVKYLKR